MAKCTEWNSVMIPSPALMGQEWNMNQEYNDYNDSFSTRMEYNGTLMYPKPILLCMVSDALRQQHDSTDRSTHPRGLVFACDGSGMIGHSKG